MLSSLIETAARKQRESEKDDGAFAQVPNGLAQRRRVLTHVDGFSVNGCGVGPTVLRVNAGRL